MCSTTSPGSPLTDGGALRIPGQLLRILVLCADPGVPIHGPSGASAHLRGVARGMQTAGHRVTVAALRHSDHRGRMDSPLGVPAITSGRLSWPPRLRTFGERADALRLLRRVRGPFDLVYERYSLFCDSGLRFARRRGIPHVLEVNAPLSMERGRPSRIERRVLRGTDRVVAVSAWLGRWCAGQGAREVRVVPNGSDLVRVPSTTPGLRLVHHGSLRPWHGVEFLPRVLDALPGAELWTLGEMMVRHPRARSRPSMEPAALGAALSQCDVGLLPYPRDAPPWFDPLKLRDYQAIGCPTVGSRHPAVREADARVELHDVEGWARAIRAVAGTGVARPRPWRVVVGEALAGL
jgi:hypothetical protein